MPSDRVSDLPRIGLNAYIRSRWGIITNVEPFDTRGPEGILHLVTIEYGATDGGGDDTVVWEREGDARVLEISKIGDLSSTKPMDPEDHAAMIAAARWNALTPFLSPYAPNERARNLASSPLFGAVQGEDYQMVPLLQALSMERISLLLADDVGLGKTIETGLILTELLLRRKIRRVLILTPASLKGQWKEEMKERFSLGFDVIDREETSRFRRNQGLDANPWRLIPRIIASYYYLRQPDVLEQFLSTCRDAIRPGGEGGRLPWDLLIVDEAHNLMPVPFGEESDLTKMLREIGPYFEHKLFLTATPHNGHTRSFTGLLELLDPVRFVQKSELSDTERTLVKTLVVRRLKREINAQDKAANRPQRFVDRSVCPEPVYLSPSEVKIYDAFNTFRASMKRLVRSAGIEKNRVGAFAVEILAKRLLSCPFAFADSWFRMVRNLREDSPASELGTPTEISAETANEAAVKRAKRDLDNETENDQEKSSREGFASATVGAWLKPWASQMKSEIDGIDAAIAALGIHSADPLKAPEDSRIERLIDTIDSEIREGDGWRDDERMIVFTEYKTTLDYLNAKLNQHYPDDANRIALLYGGSDPTMNAQRREEIKRRFNDPKDPVRLLLATDTASEGLNLQTTAHRLFHFDIPWNPSRLEQRNGRLDRHGQARNVVVYHFTCEQNLDLAFLATIVEKVQQIREDLGSMGEVFDRAFQRRLLDGEEVRAVVADLDQDIKRRKSLITVPAADRSTIDGDIERYRAALGFTPEAFKRFMDRAMTGANAPPPRLTGPESFCKYRLKLPLSNDWKRLIEDEIADPESRAIPALIFDGTACIEQIHGRPLFKVPADSRLLHLGHPLVREALAVWSRRRYEAWVDRRGGAGPWTVHRGKVPAGAQGLLRLTVEELAVNELREAFHHWVRTWECQIDNAGNLTQPVPIIVEASSATMATREDDSSVKLIESARRIFLDIEADIADAFSTIRENLNADLKPLLEEATKEEIGKEKERLDARIAEINVAMRGSNVRAISKELDALIAEGETWLFEEISRDETERKLRLEEELELRQRRYRELRGYLEKEQKRLLEEVLPRRYKLAGNVQVFPVGVVLVLPETTV
jgi:hypothetical protein